jgi:hypothetical protein
MDEHFGAGSAAWPPVYYPECIDHAARAVTARARVQGGARSMANLIAGILSLAVALGFLGVLVYKVTSVPLWAVVLLGAAMMVASVVEALRANGNG